VPQAVASGVLRDAGIPDRRFHGLLQHGSVKMMPAFQSASRIHGNLPRGKNVLPYQFS
jgi:hypothetical protein